MPASTTDQPEQRGQNRLLSRLPADVRGRLLDDIDPVRPVFKEAIYEPDRPLPYVYFPVDAVFSLLTVLDEGGAVEVATVGNEGMLGLPVFLHAEVGRGRVFCQIVGEVLRMRAGRFREHVQREPALRDLLLRYTEAFLTLLAQTAACNRAHAVEARLARWLLMTHDRVGRDEFPLTQEFMGQMLGVRRATVSETAAALQEAGLISYTRGVITIEDSPGLERAACECYRIIRSEFEQLLGVPQG
jgi:CRP-like cAMP-binding protein